MSNNYQIEKTYMIYIVRDWERFKNLEHVKSFDSKIADIELEYFQSYKLLLSDSEAQSKMCEEQKQ